jgi:hypothetical protein
MKTRLLIALMLLPAAVSARSSAHRVAACIAWLLILGLFTGLACEQFSCADEDIAVVGGP